MARAALALYEATGSQAVLAPPSAWSKPRSGMFADASGGLFTTAADAGDVPLDPPAHRRRQRHPVGTGLMAEVCARLYHLTGDASMASARRAPCCAPSAARPIGLTAMPTLLAAADLLEEAAVAVIAGAADLARSQRALAAAAPRRAGPRGRRAARPAIRTAAARPSGPRQDAPAGRRCCMPLSSRRRLRPADRRLPPPWPRPCGRGHERRPACRPLDSVSSPPDSRPRPGPPSPPEETTRLPQLSCIRQLGDLTVSEEAGASSPWIGAGAATRPRHHCFVRARDATACLFRR